MSHSRYLILPVFESLKVGELLIIVSSLKLTGGGMHLAYSTTLSRRLAETKRELGSAAATGNSGLTSQPVDHL
jgi:hypothetical protein